LCFIPFSIIAKLVLEFCGHETPSERHYSIQVCLSTKLLLIMKKLSLEKMSEVKGGSALPDLAYHIMMFVAACISSGLTDIGWSEEGDLVCS